ncbi:MAG TPA: hypothetical protein VFQ42_19180 [Mycobacterium sp.]|nr:hypothetical protein [Mycobacterium sp.]
MITAPPPDPATIATVEDATEAIKTVDELRRALIDSPRTPATWLAIAEAYDTQAAIYSRMMTLAAIANPPAIYYAARDASQHCATQAAIFRARARKAEGRGW